MDSNFEDSLGSYSVTDNSVDSSVESNGLPITRTVECSPDTIPSSMTVPNDITLDATRSKYFSKSCFGNCNRPLKLDNYK